MQLNTKEELQELLKKHKGILNISTIDYLESLIELEFSVIRNYISENDRAVLSQLELYKKVATYNIYKKALNIFEKYEELKISDNDEEIDSLIVYAPLGKKKTKLFGFNYEGDLENQIGTISLFQTIQDKEKRKAEINRINKKLEKLYNERNPYPNNNGSLLSFGNDLFDDDLDFVIGGPSQDWDVEHQIEKERYEKKLAKLNKTKLTDKDKKEIEIRKKFHDLLLEDYGLTSSGFETLEEDKKEQTELRKTLIKKMPNLVIEDNIKYM